MCRNVTEGLSPCHTFDMLLNAAALFLSQKLLDHIRDAALFTASCDQIGDYLDFFYGVLHCDADPGFADHADIVQSVAKGHHLAAVQPEMGGER